MTKGEGFVRKFSFGPNPDKTLGARAKVTSHSIEVKLAQKRGLYSPDGGLPDVRAIRDVFGLTPYGVVGQGDGDWIPGIVPGCRKVKRTTNDGQEHDDNLGLVLD
jgi:hypothetical protein